MFFGLLLCTACLGFDQPAATAARPPDIARVQDAYLKAKSQIGRNADDHVRLALWCEAHRLEPERLKHLMIAVLKDPTHPTARGLLGLVASADGWHSPDAVTKKLDADETIAALRAEDSARRAKARSSSDAHWKLALWCDRQGLKPEATAHLVAVTQLEPTREAAWKRLGYRLHAGRWVTEAQLADLKAEVQAQSKADDHWMPILARWRKELDEPAKSAAATRSLHGVVDPRAVPSVWAIFAVGKSARHRMAVQILGQIDSPSSTGALSLLAVASASAEVRSKATQTLHLRDPRDSAATLVGLLRDPALDPDPILYHYFVQTVAQKQSARRVSCSFAGQGMTCSGTTPLMTHAACLLLASRFHRHRTAMHWLCATRRNDRPWTYPARSRRSCASLRRTSPRPSCMSGR